MFVHFADSAGRVFTSDVEPIAPYEVGSVLRDESFENLVIVDREPDDRVSRLETSVLILTLARLLESSGDGGGGRGDSAKSIVRNASDAGGGGGESNELFVQHGSAPTESDASETLAKPIARNPDVRVFLPRMEHDLYGEAMIQREFYRNIPNIVVIPI